MNHSPQPHSHPLSRNESGSSGLSALQKHTQEQVDQLAGFALSTLGTSLLQLIPELDKYKLSFLQYFLLRKIKDGAYLTMSDIAKKLGYTNAATTGQIDRLEMLGYVVREHSKADRRKIIVTITEKGSTILGELDQHIHKNISDTLAESGF